MPSSFERSVATMTPETYWRALVETGWLDGLPPAHHAEVAATVQTAFEDHPADAWAALAAITFDSECIYGVAPDPLSYAVHLQRIAEATYGVFQPLAIHDRQEGDAIVITLDYPGRREEIRVDAASGYFSPRVIAFVNGTLPAPGPPGRLVVLPAVDQMLSIAVTRPEAFRLAQERGLIPTDRELIPSPRRF